MYFLVIEKVSCSSVLMWSTRHYQMCFHLRSLCFCGVPEVLGHTFTHFTYVFLSMPYFCPPPPFFIQNMISIHIEGGGEDKRGIDKSCRAYETKREKFFVCVFSPYRRSSSSIVVLFLVVVAARFL